VAQAIEAHCRVPAMDISGRRHAGFLTAEDLAAWKARVEESTRLSSRGATVHKTQPWGQGPVFLQQLSLIRGFDLNAMGFLSADHVHTVTESAKLAFADREAWYGDPDFADVPLEALFAESYASQRRGLIRKQASFELRPGTVNGRRPVLPRAVSGLSVARGDGPPQVVVDASLAGHARGDTCHVDVIDRAGNMVTATPSGGWLQSSPVIAGLGFCLGTRAQMFTLDEGHPNALQGGKRPRTTLSPTLVVRGEEPWLAFGTPGGDQQDQWSFNFFLAHADFGLNLQEAIDAPMFHNRHFPNSFFPHESFPGLLLLENRVEASMAVELGNRGHDLVLQDPWSLGRLCAVGKDPATGQLMAAANPRGMQGYAAGR
jgi:gamma-glutamyltranspeptidase/glutathione hydrolase